MSEKSTLVYLVHQIQSEMLKIVRLREPESDEQDCVCNYSPSAGSVRSVLDYARLLQVEDTESIGKVEWLLN